MSSGDPDQSVEPAAPLDDQGRPRSFPVPKRRKPMAAEVEEEEVDEEETHAGRDWHRLLLAGLLVVSVCAAGVVAWLVFGPGEDRSGAREGVPEQPVSTDPAVAVYFAASGGRVEALPDFTRWPLELPPPPVAAAADPGPVPAAAALPSGEKNESEADGVFDLLAEPSGGKKEAVPVAVEGKPGEVPPPAPAPVSDAVTAKTKEIEERYLNALIEASRRAPRETEGQFKAEIERAKKGLPMPPPRPGLYREIHRLQCIYRRQTTGEPIPVPPATSREITLFIMGSMPVKVRLNGEEVMMLEPWVHISPEGRYETQKATLTVNLRDVLGFECGPQGKYHFFSMAAREGDRDLFCSRKQWESTGAASDEWWKGGDGVSGMTVVQTKGTGYPASAARDFQHQTRVRFSDYDVIWASGAETAGFRYRIRKEDITEEAAR